MINGRCDDVLRHLTDLVYKMDAPALPDELADLPLLVDLHEMLLDIRETVGSFSRGDLSRKIKSKGALAGGLKGLQADLKHLTWQVEQVEKADFTQRVSFMGEFSDAFNKMTTQLESSMRMLEEKEARFRHMACHDALTGAYNRSFFMMEGEKLLEEAAKANNPFGLIMVDIDKFKLFNDAYGHQAGDAVLHHTVEVFRDTLRDNDPIYRYGGEEFVIILKATSIASARAVAERMRFALEGTPITWETAQLPVTASFGVSVTDPDSGYKYPFSFVIKMADANMYAAKSKGRNCVVCGVCPCPPQRRGHEHEARV